jgi:hypothetical protein
MTIGQLNNLFLTQLEMKHGEGKTKTKFEGDEYYDLAWYLGVDDCMNGEQVVDYIKDLINNPDYAKDFIADYEDWVEEKRRDMEDD